MIRRVLDTWRRFWALSWWWKAPALAIIPLIFLGIGLVIAAGGDSDTTVFEVTLKPSPASTGVVCSDGASTVSDRVESHYRALGYVDTTYEGMGDEAFDVYFSLCVESSDGHVDLYYFCYGVAENAWRYFFNQDDAAGWLPDCLSPTQSS